MVSRRRTKQLKRLRNDAQDLWRDQQAVLDKANGVLRSASTQAGLLTKEELVPRARGAYEDRVKPTVDKGVGGARSAVFDNLVPAVTSIGVAATALAGTARDRAGDLGDKASKAAGKATKDGSKKAEHAKKALKAAAAVQVAKAAKPTKKKAKVAAKTAKGLAAVKLAQKALPEKKSGPGAGGIIGIVLGVLVLAGIGYAVWQTLRADDDLWVADDEPEIPPTTDAPTV